VEGASQRDRWDRAVLPSLLGGCVLRGAERKDPDELARELSEAVKPKLYAHEGYADAFPRRLRRAKPKHHLLASSPP